MPTLLDRVYRLAPTVEADISAPCPWPNNPLIPHIPQRVTNFQGKKGKTGKFSPGQARMNSNPSTRPALASNTHRIASA